jgi:secondary thiamine-phosphate synthase enzyme
MESIVTRLGIQTQHDTQLIDITERVRGVVAETGIRSGTANVMTLHTTTAITVNEGLPDLEDDLVELLATLAPTGRPYRHARFLHSDGQMAVNAPSHLRGALLGMQVILPVEDGRPVLGARQTIYFVELDGPLYREAVVHVFGERGP